MGGRMTIVYIYSKIFYSAYNGFKNSNIKYYIYGNEIASKDIICDLDVHVSNDLSLNDRIYVFCKKAYWVINNIFHSFCCKDPNVYVKAYSSFVRPHLEYASCIWSPYKAGIIKYIEKVQKYFTRQLFIRCKIVHACTLFRSIRNIETSVA